MEAGEKFRLIRKQRKLSLNKLASIAGSAASISDFENGKTRLSNDVLFHLLSYMIVEINEFFEREEFYKKTFSEMVTKLQRAVEKGDTAVLSACREEFSRLYHAEGQYIYRIISLNIAVIIADIRRETVEENWVAELTDYFFSIDYWTNVDVGLFGNIVRYFTTTSIAVFAKTIFRDLPRPPRNNIDRIKIDTLLNCASVFIEKREKEQAQALLLQLNSLLYPSYFSFEKLHLQELRAMNQSIWGDQEQAAALHQQVLAAVNLLFGSEETAAWAAEFQAKTTAYTGTDSGILKASQ